jgi:hypothetical protein
MAIDNNLLPTNSFSVLIGGTKQYPRLNFFATSVTFPGISVSEVATSYRNKQGFVPSETLKYDPLEITFQCDEKMKVYDELFNWMKVNTSSHTYKTEDIVVSLLTSHNNFSRSIQCINAFPVSITGITFNAQADAIEFGTLTVSFRYDEFRFIQ